jgi:beta-lactamase superfamily II metal-dependent hydrolase
MFNCDSRIVPIFAGAFTCFFASCGLPDGPSAADPALRVHFVDVGQGDACLLRAPDGRDFLYDIGNHPGKLARFLRDADVDSIEACLVSHPDRDHFGAFSALAGIPVKTWYLPEAAGRDSAWDDFMRILDDWEAEKETLHAGDSLMWPGGLGAAVLWPPRHFSGSDNDRSLVLRVVWQGTALLLTGDVEAEAEAGLLRSGRNLSASLLKVAHHGSRSSSSLPFLAAVAPRFAVISCDSSAYGHPHQETVAGLERILGSSERIVRTDREGTLTFELDGFGVRRIGDEGGKKVTRGQ